MKKDGFIATSILYTFFLVFITLFVALITNYLHNRVLLNAVDELAKETLNGINNTKFTDLKIGDEIRFSNKSTPSTVNSKVLNFSLNDEANWIVADIRGTGTRKTYYLLSDFKAQIPVVTRRLPSDYVPLRHSVTIDVMEYLSTTNNRDGYKDDILFYNKGLERGVFTANDFKISIPKASLLATVRNSNLSEPIKDAILGVDGDYAVYVDGSYGGFSNGTYVLLKRYNFAMGRSQNDYVPSYCSATYDGKNLAYSGTNAGTSAFGFTHVVGESVNSSGTVNSYVDYCNYASPVSYTHLRSQNVVNVDETKNNDIIALKYLAVTYQYRLMAEITVDENSEYTYIFGGRGTAVDPYLMIDGGNNNEN